MQDTIYIILSSDKVVRMTKTPPSLKRNERVVNLLVNVDDKIFEEPTLQGKVDITNNCQSLNLQIHYLEQQLIETNKRLDEVDEEKQT